MTGGRRQRRAGPLIFGRRGGVLVGHWPALDALGVDAIVTTRDGGVSKGPYEGLNLGLHVGDEAASVVENRRRALDALGASLDDAVFPEQVHGAGTAVVDRSDGGRGAYRLSDAPAATDALVTATPGIVVTILVADCVPALLVDPERRILAVVHAGWRGTVAGVITEAVGTMVSLGAVPEHVRVALGPAVDRDRYRVGPEVAQAVAGAAGQRGTDVALERPDGWHVDLLAANRHQLESVGVPAECIVGSGTSTDDQRFFSDRRARPCGRFALLARLRP